MIFLIIYFYNWSFLSSRAEILIRKEYAKDFQETSPINDYKKVFVDESGFNLPMRINQGRSRRGCSVGSIVPTIRGQSVTWLAAITVNELFTGNYL